MLDLLNYEFFRNALIAVASISVASAVIGTYIVTRRLVAISGGVTHACFGGLGLGYFLGLNPIIMAAIFAVGSSLGVEWMSSRGRVREDSAIAAVWSLGMALGVFFVFLTPGYVPELNSFLFGNILTVSTADLWVFGIYTAVLIASMCMWHRTIVMCAFDSDFARVAGLPVGRVNCFMTVMTAVCIVLTIKLIGVMLLMSMLSLPQMIAEVWCRRFNTIMYASVGVSLGCCLAGLGLSTVIDVPCSSMIVLVMVAVFLVVRGVDALRHIRAGVSA